MLHSSCRLTPRLICFPKVLRRPAIHRRGDQLDHVTVRIFEVQISVLVFLVSQGAFENLDAFGVKIFGCPVYLFGRAEP